MGFVPYPEGRAFAGTGAPGRLLEHLLGIDENNHDSPDLMDWELKFHEGGSLITLFHKDPEPRGMLRQMVHEYGWDDAKGRVSFRHTIHGESPRGFYVVNEADRVLVRNKLKDGVVPYWTHDTLMNCCGAKLRRLIVVDGERVKYPVNGVKYNSATAYWEFDIGGFCNALEQGKVAIDFDTRTKEGPGTALRNHGTKFRVSVDNLASLYRNSTKITSR